MQNFGKLSWIITNLSSICPWISPGLRRAQKEVLAFSSHYHRNSTMGCKSILNFFTFECFFLYQARYCRQSNVSLFVVLLSAYTAFLYRYSGSQKQFSIGIPAANRTPNIKHLIGYFINVLVMSILSIFRSSSSPLFLSNIDMKIEDQSFCELTERIKTQVLRCMEHKDMPILKLIEATRLGNYSPFFQNMFIMHQPVEDFVRAAYLLPSLLYFSPLYLSKASLITKVLAISCLKAGK